MGCDLRNLALQHTAVALRRTVESSPLCQGPVLQMDLPAGVVARGRYCLEGRCVVVTGAAGGIGGGLAAAFVAQGCCVVLLDRPAAAARLDEVAAALRAGSSVSHPASSSQSVHSYACDLSSDTEVALLVPQLRTLLGDEGRVHCLVNNAGTEYPTPLGSDAPDCMARWESLLVNNTGSMVRLLRALLPLLGEGASVINQASIWGHTAVADFSSYCASKHAVVGLTRSLAAELGPRGIRVNSVCPGWIWTDAAKRSLAHQAEAQGVSLADATAKTLAAQAIPTALSPHDIAAVYLFLASPDSSSLTGQSLVASCGEVMH